MQAPHADSRSAFEPERRVHSVAAGLVWVATAFYALVLLWGVAGRVAAGHGAVIGSRGIAAENMWAWHVLGPIREYWTTPPDPKAFYCNHPWGTFWFVALLAKLLGRHAWVPRLTAIALSVATPPMIYDTGRVLWGRVPGALSALAYVILPITLAFGDFPGFEPALVFGMVLATWGYVRFSERWKRRWSAVSLAGLLWTVNADWNGAVFVAAILGALLVGHLVLPARWFGRVNERRFSQWWAWAAVVGVVVPVAYVVYFARIGALPGLLEQEGERARGHEVPLAEVLAARRTWIDATFTPLAVLLGKIAAPVFAVRVLVLRRIREVFPLGMLAVAVVHYVCFKHGADLHIYWSFPFAPYFALSVGVLAATASSLVVRVGARLRGSGAPRREAVDAVVLTLAAGLLLAIAPDALRGFVYARRTCGRFNDDGRLNFREIDKATALEWFAARMAPGSLVDVLPSLRATWAVPWALHAPTLTLPAVPGPGDQEPRYVVGDLAFMSAAEQKDLATRFHVTAIGQFVMVDRREAPAPVDAYVFDAREPTALEWYVAYGVDPVRTIRPDPWYTWELRDAWGVKTPGPLPPGEPASADELRVAHNAAVASGDDARAAALEARLVALLDVSVRTDLADGTELLGRRVTSGVAPTLEVYFRAAAPSPGDVQVEITSEVVRPPPLSMVPRDDVIKQVGMPFVLPPRLWKRGYLYVDRTELSPRPGSERLTLRYGPARLDVLSLP